jgi:hypothetical protein
VSLYPNFFTVNVTVYFLGTLYLCMGFWTVEVVPSPKFQNQEVGDPVLLSLKFNVGGVVEKEGIMSKSAARTFIITACLACTFFE